MFGFIYSGVIIARQIASLIRFFCGLAKTVSRDSTLQNVIGRMQINGTHTAQSVMATRRLQREILKKSKKSDEDTSHLKNDRNIP